MDGAFLDHLHRVAAALTAIGDPSVCDAFYEGLRASLAVAHDRQTARETLALLATPHDTFWMGLAAATCTRLNAP
jgi:hypothetical protein